MERRTYELRIPSSTLLKIAVAVAVAAALVKLVPLILLGLLASLLAVTMAPALTWMVRKGVPRALGIGVIVLVLCGLLAVFLGVILPSIIDQLTTVAKDLPKYRDDLIARFSEHGLLRKPLDGYLHFEKNPSSGKWLEKAVAFSQEIAGAVAQFLVLLILSIYLMIDGPRVLRYFADFFPQATRYKIHRTTSEISSVIFAYVAGQIITSVLAFVGALAVLVVLKVPAALALAVLAAVFDILPILGFFLTVIPSVLLAFTVSPSAALIAAAYYVGHNAVENYLIIPKVYGTRLRLSTLTVLVSLLAAAMIAGVPGAILALPVVASYPIIERIWLVPWLGANVIERHEEHKAG